MLGVLAVSVLALHVPHALEVTHHTLTLKLSKGQLFAEDGTVLPFDWNGEAGNSRLKDAYTQQQEERGHNGLALADSNVTQSKIIYRPSRARCVSYNGKRLCAQDHNDPKCPRQFFRSAYTSCVLLADFLNELNAATTTIKLDWWSDPKCVIHRTLCEVHHPHHDKQYEEELYDFSDSCKESVHLEYQYLYNISLENDVLLKHYHGVVTMKHGDEQVILSLKRAGRVLREDRLAVLLYERDTSGHVVYKTRGLDMTKLAPPTADMTGMYAQFDFRIIAYKYSSDGSVRRSQIHQHVNFRVTPYPVFQTCPAKERGDWKALRPVTIVAHNEEKAGKEGLIIGVIAGLLVCVAASSFGIHYYLMKRKEYYAHKAELQAQRIEVAQSNMHTMHTQMMTQVPVAVPAITPGVAVEGVIFDPEEACVAAPLPPPQQQQM